LPDDAAPSEQQVLGLTGDAQAQSDGARFMDIMASVYNRSIGNDMFGVPLIRLDKDFRVVSGAAKEWSVGSDGLTWSFKIRDDLNWSDGSPVTAEDWVASFRHVAKKETGYDFAWFFEEMNIANFSKSLKGEAKPEEIGVKVGANPKELVFTTAKPIPYFPMLMLYTPPLSAKALAAHGPTYNADLKTTVSSGPYVLTEWTPTRVVVEANKNMPDDLKPYLNKIIFIRPKDELQAFQANEVERARVGGAAGVKLIQTDAELGKLAAQDPGDFRIHYFFFDQSKPPFNNVKVRQAFAKLFDRETIVKKILPPPAADPAYSFLAPGFPGANEEALKPLQNYDPETAKKLYADSGVKITDKLTLQVRIGNPIEEALVAMSQVYADELKKQLGVEVEVKRVESKVFMEGLNAKPTKIDFGFVSYGLDYLDQSNMLSVFRTDGRHNWNNSKYQELIDKALGEIDTKKRDEMYKEAEKILVEDVGGIFALQQFDLWVWKPYISGATFQPGKFNTARGVGYPGFTSLSPGSIDTYVTKDVTKFRANPPK
jgi:ABC-type transport system substrate-binding protein